MPYKLAHQFQILDAGRYLGMLFAWETDRGSPTRAWMECQDWFTPWTEVMAYGDDPESQQFKHVIERDVLIEYASIFYFGD